VPQDRAHRSDVPAPGGDPSIGTQGSVADGRGAGTYFLGRYRVVDEIGVGGMASVHLARMDGPGGFQKWVAIKRIHPHLVEDQTFIHMFLDEARIAARISHSNVATVFDLGEHEDTYWIAMEYLHGEPLREVMRRTEEITAPMPPEIACRVIADAAEGLHAAHELLGKNGEKLGLVHRDVTPHNLFVTYDGTTKVVDFGIAKFSSRMSSTRAGTLKGKLAYMSPEQVHGEGIDRRTDLFALGVVLWELTTGQRLFRMESDLDTLAKVQECNVPRPSTIVRGYPIDLEKIVMKALSKNRGERFKTAREFSRALQSLLMRRGLFVASDEVAGYMKQIFDDRIKKREAHLRWAAEVTQTISIEGILSRPQPPIANESSLGTFNSEVQAAPSSGRIGGVRPAAGIPAERPPNLLSQSAPTARPAGRQPDTVRPPAKVAAHPSADDPPSDEGPTLQASPKARAQMMAEAQALGVPDIGDVGGEEGEEDTDDTIVTTTRVEPAKNPIAAIAPVPAAGKPATTPPPSSTQRGPSPWARESVAFAAPPRIAPPRATPPPPLPPVVVAPIAPASSGAESRSTAHVDRLLAEALAEQHGVVPEPQPPVPVIDDALRLPPVPRQNQPTVPRLFAPPLPSELRTDTARKLGRPPPAWLVALGAFVAALFAAGLVIAFASWSAKRDAERAAASMSSAGATAFPTGQATTPSARTLRPDTAPTGPFGVARSAFAFAIAAAPPPPEPQPPFATPPSAASAAAASSSPTPPTNDAPRPAATDGPRATAPLPVVAGPVPRQAPHHPAPAPVASGGSDQGQLSIICFPACDAVYDNGVLIGPSPIFKHTANVGEHKLQMTSSHPAVTKVRSAIVMGGQTTTVRQPMTP
jgi:eukaryotic-like serine/threonine-protein kinase